MPNEDEDTRVGEQLLHARGSYRIDWSVKMIFTFFQPLHRKSGGTVQTSEINTTWCRLTALKKNLMSFLHAALGLSLKSHEEGHCTPPLPECRGCLQPCCVHGRQIRFQVLLLRRASERASDSEASDNLWRFLRARDKTGQTEITSVR